ncbi:MAG: nuclear transport factor 2 family protein [Acidobacteriota bacterium]|nr:nuclear transport factor 2 family protein [Acidobacteriota bacterium]
MRQLLIFLILIIAITPFTFGQTATKAKDESKTVKEVKQVLRQIEEASVRMDKSALERLLADDFTFANSVGVASVKRQHIEAFGPDKFKLDSIVTDEEKVRLYGNTAVVTRSSEVKSQVGGRDISGKVRSLMVLAKQDGRWQLVAQQDTRIIQPQTR